MSLSDELLDLEAVKAVRRQGERVLKIEPFSSEIPGTEAVEIRTDMRSLSMKIRSVLDHARDKGEINGWEWIERPKKKYKDRSLNNSAVSDRKSKGYKPGHYLISIRE